MNLPNKLTVFRMLLVPIIIIVWLLGIPNVTLNVLSSQIDLSKLLSAILFLIASLTDMLDGQIARKNNLITSFGKFIDPIADKLLVNTSFILLAFNSEVPLVAVLVMIWRDTIVDAIRMMASNKGKVMAAGMLGKLKTVTQMIAIICAFLNNIPFAFFNVPVTTMLVWAACVISVLSGISYFRQAKNILMESM